MGVELVLDRTIKLPAPNRQSLGYTCSYLGWGWNWYWTRRPHYLPLIGKVSRLYLLLPGMGVELVLDRTIKLPAPTWDGDGTGTGQGDPTTWP